MLTLFLSSNFLNAILPGRFGGMNEILINITCVGHAFHKGGYGYP